LYQLALGITGNPEDAEDAWQNTLVRAWRGIRRLEDPEAFPTWLTKILLNEARRIAGRRKRHAAIFELKSWYFSAPAADSPEASLTEESDILTTIQGLKPEQKEVILLRYWLDLPLEEIAKITGVPINTAKTRLYRALERIRVFLEKESGKDEH